MLNEKQDHSHKVESQYQFVPNIKEAKVSRLAIRVNQTPFMSWEEAELVVAELQKQIAYSKQVAEGLKKRDS